MFEYILCVMNVQLHPLMLDFFFLFSCCSFHALCIVVHLKTLCMHFWRYFLADFNAFFLSSLSVVVVSTIFVSAVRLGSQIVEYSKEDRRGKIEKYNKFFPFFSARLLSLPAPAVIVIMPTNQKRLETRFRFSQTERNENKEEEVQWKKNCYSKFNFTCLARLLSSLFCLFPMLLPAAASSRRDIVLLTYLFIVDMFWLWWCTTMPCKL